MKSLKESWESFEQSVEFDVYPPKGSTSVFSSKAPAGEPDNNPFKVLKYSMETDL